MSANAATLYEPLTAQVLSTRDYGSFEETGRHGSVVQYKAHINDSSNSEAIIFFDEAIGLPVKQEFYSIQGDERKLQYSVALEGFRTEVDPELFTVPKTFRRQERAK